MASGRVYRIPINQLAMGATVQEIVAITASGSIPLQLEEIRVDPFDTTLAEFLVSLSVFTGTFTAGSGGTTITPTKNLLNDAAAGATCKIGNTARTAVGTGTKIQYDAGKINDVNGWAWQPTNIDHYIPIPPSACIALSLDTAPGSTFTVNGCAIFRELF